MNTKLKQLLMELEKLNLPDDQYAIYGSGPIAVRGLREPHDLDIVVKEELYNKLLDKYSEVEPGCIKIGNIEIFVSYDSSLDNPDEAINNAEKIKAFKFIRLEDLIKWKTKIGRDKDLKDIKLIKKYLAEHE